MTKPIHLLSPQEQVRYLKAKGVQFVEMDEAAAKTYLQYCNNYFKLTAYRKNYAKHPGGAKAGQYVGLDFAYLVDLAEIDRKLRYEVLQLSLGIEHHAKLAVLRLLEQQGIDAFGIVDDYVRQLNETDRRILEGEMARNRHNVYCGDMVQKYEGHYPVWVFLELISFGKLISFYKYCGERFQKREMVQEYRYLQSCRLARNAAAHNSCMLNDCRTGSAKYYQGGDFARALAAVPTLSKTARKARMSNARVQQLAVLLYTHRRIVTSATERQEAAVRLHELAVRIQLHTAYYKNNPLLASTLDFLCLLIEYWMPLEGEENQC